MKIISSKTPGAKRAFSFTLVELLIVIAVIMLLCSLLMPALHKARNKAVLINCSNNLKQFSFASAEYINDNNGYLLPKCSGDTNVTGNWWPYLLKEYIPNIKTLSCPEWKKFQSSEFNLGGYGIIVGSDDVKCSQVKNNSKKVCIVDSPWYGNKWGWATYPPSVTYSEVADQERISLRHAGRSNFLFYDAHAELVGLDVIPVGYGSGTWEYKRLFNLTVYQ